VWFWSVLAAAGYVLSLAVAVAGRLGALLPYPRLVLGLFVGIFPVFFVALITHPKSSASGMGVRIGFGDALRGCPAWLHVIVWATLAAAVLMLALGSPRRMSFSELEDHPEICAPLAMLCAAFYAVSFATIWSGRVERLAFAKRMADP
jgi:hypothetical protein